MARGNPDFFGQASILTTGTWKYALIPPVPLNVNESKTIIDIDIKGILQSLVIEISFNSILSVCRIDMTLDAGDALVEFADFAGNCVGCNSYQNVFVLSYADKVQKLMRYTLKDNISLNSRLKIVTYALIDTIIYVGGRLYYSEVE